MTNPKAERRRWPWLALPLLIAIIVGGYLFVAPRDDVAMPGPDATPQDVVAAYTDAINARDFETSNAIFPNAAHAPRGLFSGYERINLKSIDTIDGDQTQHAYVVITAEFKGGDGSLHGLETWGYTLDRNAQGRWRITSQGMG